jgi:hypothetical protein
MRFLIKKLENLIQIYTRKIKKLAQYYTLESFHFVSPTPAGHA